MVEGGVIRHKVEHQLDVPSRESFAKTRQPGLSSERVADGVGGDRETGAANVILGQVGQSRFELAAPLRVAA